MKRYLFYALASALIVLMSLISCTEPVDEIDNNNRSGNGDVPDVIVVDSDDVPNVVVVDISQETDWNYMVVGKDRSSLFLNVNETTGIPTLAYLQPETDSDKGITILFKENGLPDKTINNGHVLYFGNYSGYTFDLAIIYPDNTIEYHYGIETDINFDSYDEISPSLQARSLLGNFFKDFGWSDGLGIGSCIGMFVPGLSGLASGCGAYVVDKVMDAVVVEVIDVVGGNPEVYFAAKVLKDSFDCMKGDVLSCISMVEGAADLGVFVDTEVVNQKIEQINETIRKIEGDALTTTIPRELLEDLLLLGIEVNSGRNPPNIEGTYLLSPSVLVRSNFYDSYSPGYNFDDVQLTFSNQDNAKMTVAVNFIQGDSISNGINSFITGEGTKFSVFSEMNDTATGSQSVYIYSGEITSSGIRNHYRALIITKEGPNTISRGQGRLIYDSDGFSEKTQGQSGRQVIIDMYDSSSDGWDHSGALKIFVNGVNIPNARLNSSSSGSYSFFASSGDVVNIYWTGNTGNYHGENSFIVYYANTPPVPAFNTTSWSGSNALLFRLRDSLSNADLNQLLGSFTVSAAGPSRSIQQSRNMLPSKDILR